MTPFDISKAIKTLTNTFYDPRLVAEVLDGKKQHPRLLALIQEVKYAKGAK